MELKKMRKKFATDTNVLLLDPDAIEQFVGNDVYVFLKVIEECDTKKKGSTALAHAARTVTRKFKAWAQSVPSIKDSVGNPVPIELPGDIRVFFYDGRQPLWRDGQALSEQSDLSGDNTILEQLNALTSLIREQTRDEAREQMKTWDGFYPEPILVTNDAALYVRAKCLGFQAEGYESGKAKTPELFEPIKQMPLTFDPHPLFEGQTVYSDDVKILKNEYAMLGGESEGATSVLIKGVGNDHFVKTRFFEKKKVYGIKPINREQNYALDALLDPNIKIVALTGKAGTGKNLLALAAALQQTVEPGAIYDRVVVSRTPVSTGRELGYLPGDIDDKMAPWMRGVLDAVELLHNLSAPKTKGGKDPEHRTGAKVWQDLVDIGKAAIESPEHIRGASIAQTIFIIDEAQNMTPHEIKTFMSRISEGSKIVFLGDPWQIDNDYLDIESNGLSVMIDRAKQSPAARELFAHVHLEKTERSKVAEIAADIFN
jgi:PhoH-like ATPase